MDWSHALCKQEKGIPGIYIKLLLIIFHWQIPPNWAKCQNNVAKMTSQLSSHLSADDGGETRGSPAVTEVPVRL